MIMDWNALEECKNVNNPRWRNIKAKSVKEYNHEYYMKVTKEKRKKNKDLAEVINYGNDE